MRLQRNKNTGLNGFWDFMKKVGEAAVGALAAAAGGFVGILAASAAQYAYERFVMGNENAEVRIMGLKIYGPRTSEIRKAMNGSMEFQLENNLQAALTDQEKINLKNWVEKVVTPYVSKLGKTIKGSDNLTILKSAEYRENINKALTSLSIAYLYYKIQGNTISKRKATVISTFLFGIREAYIQALEKNGITANVKKVTLKSSGFKGLTPENFNWNKEGETSFEIFVEPNTGSVPNKGLVYAGEEKESNSFEGNFPTDKFLETGIVNNQIPKKGSDKPTLEDTTVETFQPTGKENGSNEPTDKQTLTPTTTKSGSENSNSSEKKKKSGLWWQIPTGIGIIYLITRKNN